MFILHITQNINGGAGIAAGRIVKSIQNQGFNLLLLSQNEINQYLSINNLKSFNPPELSLKNYLLERFYKYFSKQKEIFEKESLTILNKINPDVTGDFEIFTTPFSSSDITDLELYKKADIIHFHWISGVIDFPSFFSKNKKPLVWTIHDENPFRGAYHYEEDEKRNFSTFQKLNNLYLKVKKEAYLNSQNLHIVSPSFWLKNKAESSSMFVNACFYQQNYPIDSAIYKPLDAKFSKKIFEINENQFVFSFVSASVKNFRKGYDLLEPILKHSYFQNITFLIVGEKPDSLINQPNIIYTGRIIVERIMSLVYNASNFFVLPSREDNQPNTMIESLTCGTPVISFDISDNRKLLQDEHLGIICENISTESLLQVMKDCVNKTILFDKNIVSQKATKIFSEINSGIFYRKLYESIL